jgi:hypothetical protein
MLEHPAQELYQVPEQVEWMGSGLGLSFPALVVPKQAR